MNLRARLAHLERGEKSSVPLVIAEDCQDRARLMATAEKKGRPVLVLSDIDERI